MHPYPVRVLLIEDDEDDYVITRSLFSDMEGEKFDLEWITCYQSGLKQIAENKHDVYLVDYRLGQRSGLDLLREAIANGCKKPIILLTGQGDHKVDVTAMKAGAADYLVKGQIDAPMLERSIRYAIERSRTLEQLRQTLNENSQLASAIANISTGVVITDPSQPGNPIIFVNAAFTTITGYLPEEVMGRNCRFLQGKKTDMQTVQQIRDAIARRQSTHCTLLNYRKDGTLFWNELLISPVFDSEGKLTNFVGLQTDVTARMKSQEALEELRRRNELILNSAGEGIYGLDLQGNATFVNPAAARMVGWEVEELIGKPIDAILHHANADVIPPPQAACLIYHAFRDGAVHHVDNEVFWRKDGSSFPVEYISTPIWENGTLVGAVVTFQDITGAKHREAERRRSGEALRESEERYARAVQGANDGIWDWDLHTNEIYFSPRWKSMLGYGESAIGHTVEEWFGRIHPDDLNLVKVAIAAHIEGFTPHFESEHRMRHQDGSDRWMLSRGLVFRDSDGNATRMAGSQTDVTARKRAEAQLQYDALHDGLTGLPNRTLFMDRLKHTVELAQRQGHFFPAVLFLDLDRFKVINDSLGHSVGDQLLIEITQRLKECVRPGDTIARLGGDEFVILLEGVEDVAEVTTVADQIQQVLSHPFTLEGHEVFSTASIGIALSNGENNWADNLLRDADTAMYRAKAQGRAQYEIFHSGMHARAMAQLQLESDLRRAIDRHEFELHYQPIVSLKTCRIAGFESLIRWRHPDRGLVSPAEFIPLAEETGLIVPIGLWGLQESCRQMHQWQEQFPLSAPLAMSVNLSRKQFTPQLVSQIKQILQETRFNARFLKLEITESVLMENTDAATIMLSQLQELGIQISMDDFGTGYSSLSYLHRFPIDTLKIDRSFIQQVDTDGEQLAIVRTIMTLAWNLGMDVVAEGIETQKQLSQLKALRCEYGQGYFFSPPVTSQKAEELLASTPHWCMQKIFS